MYARVTSPHMKKLYGESLRKDAGVTKTLKNVAARNAHVLGGVTRSVQEVSGTFEKVFEEAADAVEEFMQRCEVVVCRLAHRLEELLTIHPLHSGTETQDVCGRD